VVERERVWVKRGVQSFALAYEADTDAEREWYAGQLRTALAAPAAPAEPIHPEFRRGYELAIDDIKEARESEFPMVVRWATSRARVWVVFEDGAEEVEFVAAPAAPAPVDTDWQAVAKVQSAKLAVAMNEPGAAERLRAVMRSPDWKPTPVAEPADSTNPVVEPKAAISSDKWREAVDQELVVCGMTADNFPTPQAAIRGLIDWHCAVQIDPAVSSSARALIEPLIHIANIAHSGGLANMTENEALIAIRRLSLASWDRAGGAGAHGNVLAALRAAAAMREE
jgi:hypothetical protein